MHFCHAICCLGDCTSSEGSATPATSLFPVSSAVLYSLTRDHLHTLIAGRPLTCEAASCSLRPLPSTPGLLDSRRFVQPTNAYSLDNTQCRLNNADKTVQCDIPLNHYIFLHAVHSTKTANHQVQAGVRVTAPTRKTVVQPTRAQFREINSSSSFKVKRKLHTAQHRILHLVCRPGSQWWTPCRTVSALGFHLQ